MNALSPSVDSQGLNLCIMRWQLLHTIERSESVACFLETEGDKNTSMYERFGFQVVDKYVVLGTTGDTIAMLRDSKKPKG